MYRSHGIFREWQQLTGNRSRILMGEESPDCTEREVLFSGRIYFDCERRILRTISRRKESATEKKPPEFIPVRVKRRGKSPPGGRRKLHRTGKPLPQQDQIGNELLLAALKVPGSGRIDR